MDYQSVWLDEAFAITVSHAPLGEMMKTAIGKFLHPPFHYLALHWVFETFGFGTLQARLVSAVFGTLSVGMVFLLGRYLFGFRTGIIAALLGAVSQYWVMYSQEARPYAMALFFTSCCIYFFLVTLLEVKLWAWWGFVASAVLLVYTQYYGALAVGSLGLVGLFSRKRSRTPALWWIGACLLTAAALAPWLASGVVENALLSSKIFHGQQPSWWAVGPFTSLRDLARFNNGAMDGVLETPVIWAFPAGLLLYTGPAVLALRHLLHPAVEPSNPEEQRDRVGILTLVLTWTIPYAVLLGWAYLGNQHDTRYVLFCSVPYYVLVARGIASFPLTKLRPALLAAGLAFAVFALKADYFMPYKGNYRDALTDLARDSRPGDCVLFFQAAPCRGCGPFTFPSGSHPPSCHRMRLSSESAVASGSGS